jgi:hypothetical protein
MAHNCEETINTSAAIVVCIFSLTLVDRDLSAAALAGEELTALAVVQTITFAILLSLLVCRGKNYRCEQPALTDAATKSLSINR